MMSWPLFDFVVSGYCMNEDYLPWFLEVQKNRRDTSWEIDDSCAH